MRLLKFFALLSDLGSYTVDIGRADSTVLAQLSFTLAGLACAQMLMSRGFALEPAGPGFAKALGYRFSGFLFRHD